MVRLASIPSARDNFYPIQWNFADASVKLNRVK